MGEPTNPNFYDFGIFGRVQTPSQNQLFLSLETPGYLKKSRKSLEYFPNIVFINLKSVETHFLSIFEKAGTEQWWRSV